MGPAARPRAESQTRPPGFTWIQPIPDPADVAVEHDTIRLAFVAALQHLPPRQRAALILCEVLHWQAAEAAELPHTPPPPANSAPHRAPPHPAPTHPQAPEAP